MEVSQDDTKALGFDWYLGNVLTTNGSTGGQVGTAPSSTAVARSRRCLPGNLAAPYRPSATIRLTSGLRNPSTSPFTLTGILTDPQFRVVLKALQQRSGAELLAQPEVTTISGRQAQ